ncbi:hypothetical protein NPIL_224391 [Nephila pilipes]|uniref:Uncharacterized protein n=1 Tax=Nephila pilipes TaxID=299642 RepID=A0A8X6NAZ6_NEPPI|nr:hypothetical protein NPIL_224391 [Nephila pilipes]
MFKSSAYMPPCWFVKAYQLAAVLNFSAPYTCLAVKFSGKTTPERFKKTLRRFFMRFTAGQTESFNAGRYLGSLHLAFGISRNLIPSTENLRAGYAVFIR